MPELTPEAAPFDGRWWSADDPTHVVGGRLELEGEFWRLVLLGWLGPWDGRPERGERAEAPRVIHGQVGTTPVSLLNIVLLRFSTDMMAGEGPYMTRLAINTAIAGLHVTDATKYRCAGVRLLHLNEWAARQPWSHSIGENDEEVVAFRKLADLPADLPDAGARLWRGWGYSGGLSSFDMTSNEQVYFDFQTPIDLSAVTHDYVRPLSNLIELAAAERTTVLELAVLPEDAEPFDFATVLTEASRSKVPEPQDSFRFLFTLSDVEFAKVMPAWWQLDSKMGVVSDLVASLRERGLVSNKFLNAASAIEGYHHHRYEAVKQSPEHKARVGRIVAAAPKEDRAWLKDKLARSHEPTFAQRLDEVVAQAGDLFPIELRSSTKWRRWVKDGRNSVAHRAPTMVDIEKEWRTAARVTTTIQWLMIIVLLRDLGIPDAVIQSGVKQDGHLEGAIRVLRETHPEWFT